MPSLVVAVATRRSALVRLTLAALGTLAAGATTLAAQATEDRPWGYGVIDAGGTLVQPLREWIGGTCCGQDAMPYRTEANGLVGFMGTNGKEQLAPKYLVASPLGYRRGFSVVRDEKGWKLVRPDGYVIEELKALGKAAPILRVLGTMTSERFYVIGNDEFVIDESGEIILRGVHNVSFGGVNGREAMFASTNLTGVTPAITYFNVMGGGRVVGPLPMRPGDTDVGRYAFNSQRVVRWDATSQRFGYADVRDSMRIAPRYVDARPFEDGFALVVDSANGAIRTSIIDTTGHVRATLTGAGACLSSFTSQRALVCFPDRIAMIDTSGRELAKVDRDYEFDASAPALGGFIYWLHHRTAAGRLEWIGLDYRGVTIVPPAAGARFSEILRNGGGGGYIVRGYESQRAGMGTAVADAAAAGAAAEAAAVAAGNARVHAGHGLQRMTNNDAPFARPPEFFPYLLVRAYVNKKIVGVPSASDYASSVVIVWAEKGHGTKPEPELSAAAGCKTPEGWALAYTGIVVPEDERRIYPAIKNVFQSVLKSDAVLNEIPCQWSLFRETF